MGPSPTTRLPPTRLRALGPELLACDLRSPQMVWWCWCVEPLAEGQGPGSWTESLTLGPLVFGGPGGRGAVGHPQKGDQVWVLERDPSWPALLAGEGFVRAGLGLLKTQFHFITAQGRESYHVSPHLYSKLTKLWINPHGRKREASVQAWIRRAACAQAPGHSALWLRRHLRSPLQLAVKEVN